MSSGVTLTLGITDVKDDPGRTVLAHHSASCGHCPTPMADTVVSYDFKNQTNKNPLDKNVQYTRDRREPLQSDKEHLITDERLNDFHLRSEIRQGWQLCSFIQHHAGGPSQKMKLFQKMK